MNARQLIALLKVELESGLSLGDYSDTRAQKLSEALGVLSPRELAYVVAEATLYDKRRFVENLEIAYNELGAE